ncbi:MAG: GAF and ANTAR domain-containing protein [Miltoncostaeaceae bacterium]
MPAGPHDRGERLLGVAAAIAAAANGEHPVEDLCRACAQILSVAGASVVVMSGGVRGLGGSSDPVSARIEELQETLGEGPSVDAHQTGHAVSEPDLATPRRPRWAAFAPAALAAGAGALFSVPLRIGGVRLGALTLYRPMPGELSAGQHLNAQALANMVANIILSMQAEASAGSLSPDLDGLVGHRSEVHQASGMVSVQLGVGVGEALVRLRAHAYATDRPLAEVAADVVARRLRFDE